MSALIANAKSPTSLAIIRSLGRQGIAVTGATDGRRDSPVYSRYCKRKIFLESDGNNENDRVDELLTILKNEAYDVFLPVLSERTLRVLLSRKQEFEAYTNLALPSLESFDLFDDKAKAAQLMNATGVSTPRTFIIGEIGELDRVGKECKFPVLIKPFHGEGSDGIEMVSHPSELAEKFKKIRANYGSCLVQEYIFGPKLTAVYLVNEQAEPIRFFVHKAIREYPITGGPTCCLESVSFPGIYDQGLKLIKASKFYGLIAMEFIVDEKDGQAKIIDINPRFYGPLEGAIVSGVDFPYEVYKLAKGIPSEPDLTYRTGVRCRNILFEDTKHLLSVLKGNKSPKYSLGRVKTLLNYMNFFTDKGYFILSVRDPMPALIKIYNILSLS